MSGERDRRRRRDQHAAEALLEELPDRRGQARAAGRITPPVPGGGRAVDGNAADPCDTIPPAAYGVTCDVAT